MSRLHLLSANSKLAKSEAKFSDIINAGLFLAPAKMSGRNVCPAAGHCAKACVLWFSGRTVFDTVRAAMIRRTKLYFDDRQQFKTLLRQDLEKLLRKSERESKTVYVRLNGGSDLDWRCIAKEYPQIRFYDYTKVRSRISKVLQREWVPSYQLTYSYSEKVDSTLWRAYLRDGGNVSMVFDTAYHPQSGTIGELPISYDGFPVIDGDLHDLRHPDFDGFGNIVGLRFKGSRKRIDAAIDAGFVVQTSDRVPVTPHLNAV